MFDRVRNAIRALGTDPKSIPGYDPSSAPGYVVDEKGQRVSNNGVGIPSVKGAIDLISTNIALSDKRIYSVDEKGIKKYKPSHNATKLLKNPSQTFNEFQWQMVVWNNILFHGNAFLWIRRSQRDQTTPVELVPCGLSQLQRINGRRRYWLNVPATNFIGLEAETKELTSGRYARNRVKPELFNWTFSESDELRFEFSEVILQRIGSLERFDEARRLSELLAITARY